jgi:uncharacterized protein (DUF302 family)
MNSVDGVLRVASHHSVSQTLDRLEDILREKGIKVFLRIDQSEEAKAVGLELAATQLLIFGNPKGGTSIMVAAPEAGVELPLKALAWQDSEGKVWVSYNDPESLKRRFGIGDELIQAISGIKLLIEKAAA